MTPPPRAAWSLQTPRAAPGAIAVIQLLADSPAALDETCARLGIPCPDPGRTPLANLFDLDHALLARWSTSTLHLMPHGGPAVVRAILAHLAAQGLPELAPLPPPDPRALFPEAADLHEARALAALAHAASPVAIDLLLDQPRRWRAHDQGLLPPPDPAHAAALAHLLTPPLVVALGRPNIGKSTLANALAERDVALVADEPGTTRDHVGQTLDLAGLVVRYADTPGLRPTPDPIEAQAQSLALDLARHADLILLLGDHASPPPDPAALGLTAPTVTVALRADLALPTWPFDLALSSKTGHNLAALPSLLRDALVPPAHLASPRPWRFWA